MQVVILDPSPCFRDGLTAALRAASFEPVDPTDVEEWARSDCSGAFVIALLDDAAAKRLRVLREWAPARAGLALLPDLTMSAFCWAIRSGATSAVARDALPEEIIDSLSAACAGSCVMPASLALELATAVDLGDHPPLGMPEVHWLVALSEGTTVGELAREAGYSDREMFRRLRNLYARMGVRGRTEALLAARRWRLL